VRRRDLPHAVFADVVVHKDTALDARVAAVAVKDHRLPACLCAVAVDREADDRRFDEHRRKAVGFDTFGAAAVTCAQERRDRFRTFGRLRRPDKAVEDELAVCGE